MGAIQALVLARARARIGMWALVALGVAIATAVPMFASASTVVASAGALEHGLADLPAGRRSVTVSYNGDLAGQDLAKADRAVRGQLRRLSGVAPVRQVAFRRMSDGRGAEFTLAAVDGLSQVVRLTSGRMPLACTPTRCEVVQVGRQPTPDTARIGVIVVGRAERTNPLLLSGTFDPGAGAPILLGASTGQIAALAVLDLFQHTWGWVAQVDVSLVRRVGVDKYLTRENDVADALSRAVPGLVVTAPADVLRAEDARAQRSGSRFALLGGTSAALVLGLAVVAAVSVRRDHLTVVRLLRTRGGTRRGRAAFTAAEATWPCLAGALLGGATAYLVAWRAWGQPVARAGLSGGLLTAAILTAVAALVVAGVLRWVPATDERGPWRTVTTVAVATAAAAALGASRGDANVEPGAPADPLVSLLPVLTAVAGGLLAARCWPVIPRVLVWLLPRRASGARLALASAVRQPLRAAATVAVLAATCCSVVFVGAYRATVDRGAADQAAFAVPMVARLTTGPTLARSADIATPDAVATLAPGAVSYPVLRTGATVALSLAESAPVEVLGLTLAALPRMARWRPDYSATPPATIARRLAVAVPVAGPAIADDARRLTIPASGSTFRLDVIALIRDGSGRSTPVTLDRRGDALVAALPAGTGRALASLTLREDPQAATVRLHAVGEGNVDLPARSGRVAFGRPTVDGRPLADDLSRWSVTAPGTGTPSTGRLVVDYRIAGNETTVQPRPTVPAAVPAYVDRTTARLARNGVLLLDLGEGKRLSVRVVATGDTFPTTRRRFAVLDRATLAAALDAMTPGAGTPTETWVWAPAGGPAQAAVRALQREPYDQLGLEVRSTIERSLRTDPVALAASRLLLGTALAGLFMGALSVVLLVVAERREAAGELFAREAEGSRPNTLRRSLFARAGAVVALGVPFGVAAGLVLARATTALVSVTAAGTTPRPPLILAAAPASVAGWLGALLLLGLGGAAVVAAASLRGALPVLPETDLR